MPHTRARRSDRAKYNAHTCAKSRARGKIGRVGIWQARSRVVAPTPCSRRPLTSEFCVQLSRHALAKPSAQWPDPPTHPPLHDHTLPSHDTPRGLWDLSVSATTTHSGPLSHCTGESNTPTQGQNFTCVLQGQGHFIFWLQMKVIFQTYLDPVRGASLVAPGSHRCACVRLQARVTWVRGVRRGADSRAQGKGVFGSFRQRESNRMSFLLSSLRRLFSFQFLFVFQVEFSHYFGHSFSDVTLFCA